MRTASAGAGIGLTLAALCGFLLIASALGIAILLALLPSQDESASNSSQCTATTSNVEAAPEEYQQPINDAAAESGVSADILAAQIDQESGFDESAVSPVGAEGPAQFMPGTWAEWGDGGDVTNPQDAVAAQGRFMGHLMDTVQDMADADDEQVRLALAAYNAGPGAVQQHNGIPPFQETENYVSTITSAADGTFTADCENRTGLPTALGGDAVDSGTDDYPWREPVGESGFAPHCTENCRDVFGHTVRQCTSFVAWRVNQALGWSHDALEDGTPPPFSAQALDLSTFGNAGSWRDNLTSVDGITFTDDDPRPGDIAWWDYGQIGGSFGHVAYVADVEGDTVILEHYNLTPNEYSVTAEDISEVPGFIQLSAGQDDT